VVRCGRRAGMVVTGARGAIGREQAQHAAHKHSAPHSPTAHTQAAIAHVHANAKSMPGVHDASAAKALKTHIKMHTALGEEAGAFGHLRDDDDGGSEAAVDRAAPREIRLLDEQVQKMDSAGYWTQRRLILTKQCLFVCSSWTAIPRKGQFKFLDNLHGWQARFVTLEQGWLAIWKDEASSLGQDGPSKPLEKLLCIDCHVEVSETRCAAGWGFTIDFKRDRRRVGLACEDRRRRGQLVSSMFKHRELLGRQKAGKAEVLDSVPLREVRDIDRFQDDFFERFAPGVDTPQDVLELGTSSTALTSNYFVPTGFSAAARTNYLAEEDTRAFVFNTIADGHNNGRTFVFRANSETSLDRWLGKMQECSTSEIDLYNRKHYWEQLQLRARALMQSTPVQVIVGLFIFASWIVTVAESQVRPQDETTISSVFETIDLSFTCVFTIELLANIVCYWFVPFLQDGWLMFDFVVVSVSIFSLAMSAISNSSSSSAKQLRVLRILRVMRVFGRLKELRKIVNGIIYSILPLIQAILVAILILSIFCTFGVEAFGEQAPASFGNFGRAFYTLFTVVLGVSCLHPCVVL